MTTLANLLAIACFLAALFRARLVAVSLAPAVMLILGTWSGLVDLSSASHPLRYVVPVSVAGLAGLAVRYELKWPLLRAKVPNDPTRILWRRDRRGLIASLLVLGSCAPDLLALRPFFWAKFATWPLVPVQIVACVSILVVLWSPERWVEKCLK